MTDRNTEDIIGALYDLVQDARSMPLAADNAFWSAIRFWICSMKLLRSCPAN